MKNDKVYLTSDGLEELKRELKERTTIIAKEIADRTEEARGMGDLSENAGYKQALEERQFNLARIDELETKIKNAVIVERNGDSSVDIGDKVKLKNDGDEKVFIIVGETEANPLKGMISNESPIGKAILGKKKGSKVKIKTPAGVSEYTIVDVK